MDHFLRGTLKLEARAGAHISSCVKEAIALRYYHELWEVTFDFNGTPVSVVEGDTVERVVWRWSYARGDFDIYGPVPER